MTSNTKIFRSYVISLTANQEYPLRVFGNMYGVVSSTGPFTITFDESSRITGTTAGTGGEFEGKYENVVFLSTTTQTVVVVLGFGKYNDSRATINANISTTIAPSDTLGDPGDVSVGVAATLIVAADPNRKEVMIHVPSDAANSIRIGGASVTAVAGLEVEIGSTVTLSVESAVYGIRDGGSDVVVSILDLTRP